MYIENHIKNRIAVLLICTMLMALCACGVKEGSDSKESVSLSNTTEVAEADISENSNDVTESESATYSSKEESDADEKASKLVKEIGEKLALEPEVIYSQVLDGYYADLVSEFPIDNYFPMTLGTFETTINSMSDDVLNGVGYAIKDINNDGVQELLIVKLSDRGQTRYYGEQILALYTIINNEPRFLAGGWARNRYYLLNDGRIYNEGSSGADDSSFETYRLIENSAALEQIDSQDSNSVDFEQQCEELKKLAEKVEITTFAEYETSEDYPESAKTFWAAVYVNPAEQTFAMIGSDAYTASTSEYAKELVFFTPTEVTDFRFNSLTPVESKDGETYFEEEEIYSLDSLVMDKAVTITVEFPGDIPCYDISYKDAGGNIRRYAICESGFDGSIYLIGYESIQ